MTNEVQSNQPFQLNQTFFELSNGVKFSIINDFENIDGPVNSIDAAFQNWIARTEDFSAESFVAYIKKKEPKRIALTEAQFNELQFNGLSK